MPIVYGDMQSGNCYKIALLFAELAIEHEWREILVTEGATKTDEFQSLNPAGQIPVVVLDDGAVLTQSNAILHYFAAGSALVPSDQLLFARVLEWQFFEQYSHEPTIAVRRFIQHYLGLPDDRKAQYDNLESGGYRALDVMEKRLGEHEYLVGTDYTLADISLYAYTHVAYEGGFDLGNYKGIGRWLERIASRPAHIGMS